jgi:hypothetical protein
MTLYTALTPAQQAQIESVFCDAFFESHPDAYDYELDQRGSVSGRLPLAGGPRERAPKIRSITCVYINIPGDEIVMDCLANLLARFTLKELEHDHKSIVPANVG